MNRPDPERRAEQREAGQAPTPEEKVPTYQELLDEALEDTFPASDPIAVGAATKPKAPVPSPRDERDWTLQPSETPPPETGAAAEATEEPGDEPSAPAAESLGRAVSSPVLDSSKPAPGRGQRSSRRA